VFPQVKECPRGDLPTYDTQFSPSSSGLTCTNEAAEFKMGSSDELYLAFRPRPADRRFHAACDPFGPADCESSALIRGAARSTVMVPPWGRTQMGPGVADRDAGADDRFGL